MDPRTSAQDVMRCDLCETAIVQMHCDTCLINLCKACVGEHITTDESKDHKVVKFQSRKSTPLYPGCTSHDKERCEMYCRHCDIPVCQSCLASDQHLGHKLSKILQVQSEKKDMIKKELTELNETIYPTYQGIASDVQNRISHLEKKYGDLSSAITKHGENLQREIDKLVNNLKAQVEEMKTSQLQALKKNLDEINKKIADIKNDIDSLENAVDSNDISSLFSVRSKVDQYENLPQTLVASVPKFTPGTIQREGLNKLFGALSSVSLTTEEHGYRIKTKQESIEVGSSPSVKENSPSVFSSPSVKQKSVTVFTSHFVKKLLDKPEIFNTNIKENLLLFRNVRSCYFQNIACLGNEKIWTCGETSTMKLYNINQALPLNSIRTKSGNSPTDIAVTRSGDLIYTDKKDRTVNIVKNEEIEEVIRLQNWRPRNVSCTSSGDLLVTMESDDNKQSKVVRYSGSTEKQSIQFDDKGKSLYGAGESRKYVCENKNLDICVADCGAKEVVVVNQAGKLRFKYIGHSPAPKNKPFSPREITTDSQSNILTRDCDNHCVHITDQDGQFLCYIELGHMFNSGLCTDADDNLFFAYRFVPTCSSYVKRIKYLQ